MSEAVVDKLKVVLEGDDADYASVLEAAEAKTLAMVDNIIAAGTKMTLAITGSLSAISAYSVSAFSDFDGAMTSSLAIMDGITPAIKDQMSDLAVTMSMETTTSATKLAEAYQFLGSSGLTAKQSMDALSVVNKFSIAGQFDLARATDMLADSQSALGLRSDDSAQNMANMARVADVLTKANILSNASVEQFATSLTTKTAAALRGLNKPMEEGVAVLAAYADQGIKAQLSGEKLAVLLRESATASQKEAAAWKQFGVELYDTEGKMVPIVDLIRQLEKATAGMSDQQKFATFHMMGFRAESMDAIKPLLGMSDKIAGYEKALMSAGGATELIANRQMKSFPAQMEIMKNQLTAVAIEIGEILAPSILAMNEMLKGAITYWRGMSDELKVVVVTMGKIAAVIGPSLVGWGMLTKMLPMITSQLSILGGQILAVFTWIRTVGLAALLPFIEVIAVVAAVSAAVYGLAYVIMGPEGLNQAWVSATTGMQWFFETSIGFLANFTTNMAMLIDWLKTNWQALAFDLVMAWVTYQKNMILNVMTVIQTYVRLWIAFAGWLSVYVPKFFKYVFSEEFIRMVWEGIVGATKAIVEFVNQAMMLYTKVFYGIGKVFVASIKAMLGISIEFAKTLGSVFSRILKGEIPNPAELIRDFMAKAGTQLASVSEAVGEAVGLAGEIAAEKLKEAQEQAVKDFNKGGSQLNFFATAGDIIGEGMAALKGPLDGFQSTVSELPEFVTKNAQEIKDELEAAQPDKMDTETTMVEPLAAAETQAKATAAAVGKIQESIEGAAMGSLDAALKIDDYFARLAASSKDAANSSTQANQNGKAGNSLVANPKASAAGGNDPGTAQRQEMIVLLTDIRNSINKPSRSLMAANLGGS